MSRGLSIILIAVVLLDGVARAEEAPPPKVRRSYGERVKLHETKPSEAKPDEKANVRLPPGTAPAGGDRLADQLTPNSMPAMLPSHPKPAGEDKEKPWSSLDKPEAAKPSGWGWLADDILRMTQTTATETRVEGQDEDKEEAWPDRNAETGSTAGSAATQPVDEEALIKARMQEDPGASANPGWQPVESRRDTTGWTPAAEDLDQRARSAAAGMAEGPAFLADSALPKLSDLSPTAFRAAELTPTPVAAGSEDLAARALQNRSLFTPGETAGEARFGRSDRATTLEPSPFTPAASSVGGFPAPAAPGTFFGSMSAVDIQPTLSIPAPVSPALELPSAAPSTPSLGGMGSEMDTRPKTLPW